MLGLQRPKLGAFPSDRCRPISRLRREPLRHLSPSANGVRITVINGEKLVMPFRHVLLAAAALAFATPILGADTPPPLIERAKLFGNPDKAGAQISPDGKYLSWTAPKDGVMNIWVAPLGELDAAKADHERDRASDPRVHVGVHEQASALQQDIGGDENFHCFRADLADGKITDLTPFKGALCELAALDPKQPTKDDLPHQRSRSEGARRPRDRSATGKRTMVAQNDALFSGFTLDHEMKPRFANKRRDDGSIEIQKRDKDGTWSTWDVIPHEDADTTYVMAFAPTGKAVYAIESRNRDTSALVTMISPARNRRCSRRMPRSTRRT